MNFFDKITGNDMTREFKEFEVRIEKLPLDYREAWEKIKANIWNYSDFTGRNTMPIFEGIVGMLEEANMDGQSIQQVLGDDINGFCEALADDNKAKTYKDKWRKQLNNNIAKKLGK